MNFHFFHIKVYESQTYLFPLKISRFRLPDFSFRYLRLFLQKIFNFIRSNSHSFSRVYQLL